jgi:hydrogenase nickel incorporation protein HypA/HybF
MHEATVASLVLDSIGKQAVVSEGVATSVCVRAGTFRNIDPEAFQFAFDALKTEFGATAKCRLQFELVPAVAVCNGCDKQYQPDVDNAYACPACGGGIGKLLCGEELEISNLTIDLIESTEVMTHA